MTGKEKNRAALRAIGVGRGLVVSLLLLATVVVGASCAAAMEEANTAVERAEEAGRKLGETRTPESATLTYRIHMTNAKKALEQKKWKKATSEANIAEQKARDIYEEREMLAKDIRQRLNKLMVSLESRARPRKSLVDGYFDAQEALENNDYEKADAILAKTETIALREVKITKNKEIVVQAVIDYYQHHKGIPLYEDVSDDGTPGKVVVYLNDAVTGDFLGSKIIARDIIFAHVYVYFNFKNYNGWVDGRFVQ